ncbi:MAG: 5'/3'-nucleotidase SurE [Acidobacteria bacterium]|nr:5'/3'-nucleotidase SurE [Acidobacteriota bacterium]
MARRILVTNDDGYFSPGIHALAEALATLGEVTIVAPHNEASAVGHALTLRRPLRIEDMGGRVYSVDGTPTDCVNLGIHEVLGASPDLVVSGINKGLNVGDDVTYSGTVAGALEAALLGHQALAVSLEFTAGPWNFAPAARLAAGVARELLASPLPSRTFLNLNVPQGEPRGLRVTVQAVRNHLTKIDRRVDPRGRPYFWIEEALDEWQPHDRSDYQAIRDGFASLTPLQPDLTGFTTLPMVEALAARWLG